MDVLSQLVCGVPCSPVKPFSELQLFLCADARDSIAKVAYGRVFGWIVCKINELLAENVNPEVELREIGEFCLPCSCSVLECASLSHNKEPTLHEDSQSLSAGMHYQNCNPARDKSQQHEVCRALFDSEQSVFLKQLWGCSSGALWFSREARME